MDGKLRNVIKRYGVAIALPALAVALRSVLPFPEGAGIYQLPLAAVVLSAWYGGRGPGLLASVLSIIGAAYLVPPAGSFAVHADHALPLSIFATLCLLLTEFGAGRRRSEQALRESEARFRKLTDLSVDGYWKQDENLRFTYAMDERHGFEAQSLGKTRWELPFTPLSASWDEHRADLIARKPFHGFEYTRVHPDGTTRYISVSGVPAFDDQGAFKGYDGVASDITARKLAEAERRAQVWFLESMDRINRAMQGTNDLDQMMGDVLDAVLEIFACDRAWLVYPCDPDAPSWHAVMEHTRPEFPGAFALGTDLAVTPDTAEVFRNARASAGAVLLGAGYELQTPARLAERFNIRSQMIMALLPNGDQPYLFGLHQCSRARTWTKEEQRLFEEVAHRLTDALASLIAVRRLRESEVKLEAAQRLARVGWWVRDYATGHVSLSDEACRIFGVQPLELPQWHGRWLSLIHPEDRERAAAASDEALRGVRRYDVEYRVVRPDGAVRVVHSQGDVTREESGRPVRQFGVMQDITELRQAEQQLRARQELLDLAQKAARAVAFDWYIGARERENRWSPELEVMYGLEAGSFDGTYQGWRKLIHPDDWPAVKAAIERAHKSSDIAAEYRVIHKDGAVHWLRAKGRMFFDAKGQPERMVGFMFDVTDWRHAEEALRESEARFRKLTDLSADWYWRQDENLRFTHADDEKAGYPMPVSLGKTRWELPVTPLSASWDEHRAVLAARQPFRDFQYSRIDPNGGTHYISVSGVPMFDERGAFKGYDGVASDITPRKRAEEALRASEARFRVFVDHAMDAFFLHDAQLKVIDVNRRACEFLGYKREELIGVHPRAFDATLDEASMIKLAERLARGETVTFETLHRRKDGTLLPVEIRTGTFKQAGQLFYLALARDISARKLAEEALREKDSALQMARTELARVSRVTTLGELTASIAHEVNQPIGAMVTNAGACARWLAAKPPDMAEAKAALANIVADGKRAGEVITRIRALTRREPPRMELVDVNLKVREVLALAEHELKTHGIALRTELAPALPGVAGDRVQLQQVLLNLIVNAIEAMSGVQDRARELTIVTAASEPGRVVVEVRDSGLGLDEKGAERLFEPFYTTKAQGIGIGLSISRSIVEAHGGRLGAKPNQPYGAIFRFTLPLAS